MKSWKYKLCCSKFFLFFLQFHNRHRITFFQSALSNWFCRKFSWTCIREILREMLRFSYKLVEIYCPQLAFLIKIKLRAILLTFIFFVILKASMHQKLAYLLPKMSVKLHLLTSFVLPAILNLCVQVDHVVFVHHFLT